MENQNIIQFVTDDGVQFKTPIQILKMFNHIAEDFHKLENNNIQLCGINSEIFGFILKFCDKHNCIPPPEIKRPLISNDIQVLVSEWDANYINQFDFDNVVNILVAAEKLKCLSLMDLCYARIAIFFRETSFPDLRKNFQLNDNEFNQKDVENIKNSTPDLMALDTERVKELLND